MTGVGVGVGVGLTPANGRSRYEPEARSLFAAITVQESDGVKQDINDRIRYLKERGIWSKLHGFGNLGLGTEQAALLFWNAPSKSATKVGSVTHTPGVKMTGTGGHLRLGINPSQIAGSSTSFSLGLRQHRVGEGLVDMGNGNSLIATRLAGTDPSVMAARANSTASMNATTSDGSGFYAASRLGAGAMPGDHFAWRNGLVIGTGNTASASENQEIALLGRNNGGTFTGSNSEVSYWFVAQGLTTTEMAQLEYATAPDFFT